MLNQDWSLKSFPIDKLIKFLFISDAQIFKTPSPKFILRELSVSQGAKGVPYWRDEKKRKAETNLGVR